MSVILPSTYTDGTAVCTNGSPNVVGTGTMWLNTILPGDFFWSPSGESVRIAEVVDDTHITLAYNWPGATQVTGPYEIRFQADQGRVQETTRQLLERMQSGNLYAFAGLVGATDTIPYFTAPGSMGLLNKTDLVNGVNYDVQVDTLAERDAYDTQATGYTVLVADTGDGRAAIYSKASNASGDWTNPAYITGPAGLNNRGPWSNVTAYVIDDLVSYNGASYVALVDNTNVAPVVGGSATWQVLASRGATGLTGVNPRGTYAGATAYVVSDSVLYNGSTFLAIADTTGNAPPTLPTTSNAWWQLLAQKGQDGTGTGDVVGPAGATDGNFAAFDGVTGKLIKQLTSAQARTLIGMTAANTTFDNTTANLPGNPTTVQAAINAIGNSGGKNDALFAIQIADLLGQRMGMVGGVADSFDDQTGVVTQVIGGIDQYTNVALHLDGTNGSTTITDSAFSGRAWTTNVAQISTTKSKFGGASLYVGANGAGGYIQSTSFADLSFGTGDYTIDFNFNLDAITTSHFFVDMRTADTANSVCLYIASGKVTLFLGGANVVTGATTLVTNTWYHVALVRSAGVTRIYLNGVQDGNSYTDATNYVATSLIVGNQYAKTAGNSIAGYIDEFRITKGVARWTAAFTPPTMPYNVVGGNDANATLLLHMDGANGSTSFPDSSPSPVSVTATGDAKTSTAQSKFGGSSLILDGAGDYLTTAVSSAFALGTGDFTVEGWFRPSTTPYGNLIDFRSSSQTANPVLYILNGATVGYYTASANRITSTTVLAANTWYHLALVRASGTTRLYINGVQEGVAYADSSNYASPAAGVRIGCSYSAADFFTGNIDEVRISNVARYTANFTPYNVAFFADTLGSSNFVYDATNDWFSPSLSGGAAISGALGTNFGNFTSNGGLASAFNGTTNKDTSVAAAAVSVATGWLGKTHSSTIGSVQTYGSNNAGYDAASGIQNITLTLYGKVGTAPANETDGVVLGSITFAEVTNESSPRTITSSDTTTVFDHRWVRMQTSGAAGTNLFFGQIVFFQPTSYNNMTLLSVNYTASAVPSTGRVAVQLADTLALTPNTDFTMEVSRDGGNTWSAVTLALTMPLFGGVKMYEGTVSLTGQPSGTLMAWRFKTLTGKNIIASGVVLQQS